MLVQAYEQKRHAFGAQWARKIDEIKDFYCGPSWSVLGRCLSYVRRAAAECDAELKALQEELRTVMAE